jgi:SAM-dependent methyltransferase
MRLRINSVVTTAKPPAQRLRSTPRCSYSPDAIITLTPAQRDARDRMLQQLGSGAVRLQAAPCLCGDPGGEILAERDRWGLPVTTVLCKKCGLVRTSPRLPDSVLPSFYEHDYRLLLDGITEPTPAAFRLQQRRGRETLDFLRDTGGIREGTRVYEVGCSAGGVLQPFKEADCVVAGSDYDVRFLANARSIGIETRHGGWETLKDLPAPDVLVLSHVVEHLNDPVDFIRSVSTLLKPEGRLFIAVPGLDAIREDYCGDIVRYLQICHTFHFTRQTLLWCIRQAGLTPVRADDSVRVVSMPGHVAGGLTEGREDATELRARLAELESRFLKNEGRLPRQARRLAARVKNAIVRKP